MALPYHVGDDVNFREIVLKVADKAECIVPGEEPHENVIGFILVAHPDNTARVWDREMCALVCYPCLSGALLRSAAECGVDFDACLRTLGRITASPPRRRLAAHDPGFVRLHRGHDASFSDISAARVVGVQYESRSGMEDMQALLDEVGGGRATGACREIV